MTLDQKLRILLLLAPAALALAATFLALHGVVISPLDDLGPGPH